MQSLTAKASEIEALDSIDRIWDETLGVLAQMDIKFVIYLTVNHNRDDLFLRTNIPEIYGDHSPLSDPFLEHLCKSYEIVCTGSEFSENYEYVSDEERKFIIQAGKSGFTTGLAIPMRLTGSQRFGGFNLGTGMTRAAFECKVLPKGEDLRVFCLIIHRRLEELFTHDAAAAPFRTRLLSSNAPDLLAGLTPRENEILFLLAKGMSRKECAQICRISQHTVSEYIKSLYRKLNVRNRVEAVQILAEAQT